jgi:hypothetical protein
MLLHKFDFYEPRTLNGACQIPAEYGIKARILAGLTDLPPALMASETSIRNAISNPFTRNNAIKAIKGSDLFVHSVL